MAKFVYEVSGPAAANGWETGHDSPSKTAAAAWQVVAKIARRSDPEFAAALRQRTTPGTVDHDGTRYSVTRIA